MSGTRTLWRILAGAALPGWHSITQVRSGSRQARPHAGGPEPSHGTQHRAVHQERYNPLKLDDQPQEAWAKVRQDFGVRSVTLWAWELCPT